MPQQRSLFNEATRVQMPALVHLTRIGYQYFGKIRDGVEDYVTEIPSKDILRKFGQIVLNVERKKSQILLENQQLASLRDFLLPMLMNGQVKVGRPM